MSTTFRAFLALIALPLAACATPTANIGTVDGGMVKQEEAQQRRLLLAQYGVDAKRVYQITSPIFRAAADVCSPDKVGPSWGIFDISTLEAWGKEYRDAAAVELGLTDAITFTYLEPEGPLAKAGVKVGDHFLSMNGKQYAPKQRGLKSALDDLQELGANPAAIVVRRGDQTLSLTVSPERLPRLDVNYNPVSGEVNAFADGSSLNFTRGLLRAMPSDDALAMVIAHELAHNCQLHIEAKKTNAGVGLFFDVLAAAGGVNTNGGFTKMAAGAYSQDFEREADYVGLYYLARAGRPLGESMNAYRLLTVEGSASGLTAAYGASHPSNPERFVRMQDAEKQIQQKVQANQPLIPETKVSR